MTPDKQHVAEQAQAVLERYKLGVQAIVLLAQSQQLLGVALEGKAIPQETIRELHRAIGELLEP